jgi:hypothetical protein
LFKGYFFVNLPDLLDGDASQVPYVPNGTKRFIAASTAYLCVLRYFSSIGKNFVLYCDKSFRISLCSIATLNWESLLCVIMHVITSQKKVGVAMCFVIL